jgi:beta-glucanase (GH16 family)
MKRALPMVASLCVLACSSNGPHDAATGGAGGSGGAASTSSSMHASSSRSSSAAAGGGGQGGGSLDLPGWKLVWNDEFDGPDGSDVDPTKWVHVESGNGNGNQEREYYTPGKANAFQKGGQLHIVADKLPQGGGGFTCWYGACEYTSGKLVTKADGQAPLFQKQLGRLAVRMKIPAGQGIWPAFWALGVNIDQVGWPTCGEIDVMENVGKTPATNYGTLHGPGNGMEANLGGTTMLSMGALADDFHVYAVEWKQGEVKFYLDDNAYFTGTQADFPGTWVFDAPYYLLLNLAIGGSWPGDPDGQTVFPAELLVDWVRVYDPD